MITIYLFEHGWFWLIPLPDEVMSVGLVGTQAFFKTRQADIDSFFARAVASCPSLAVHMANAEPIGALAACADYSYDAQHYVGEATSSSGTPPPSLTRCFRAAS